jgi:pimeloyl-ACP methyl ester carboxylesterase
VSKLVLAGAVGIWVRERPIADIFAVDTRFPERLKQLLFHDVECPAARMMITPGDMEMPDELLVNVMNAFAATAKIGWNPLLHDPRLESLLHRITAKTLCLWGAEDRIVPPVYGERYAKRIPGASLELIPACGHLAPLEKTDAWVRAVKGFVG